MKNKAKNRMKNSGAAICILLFGMAGCDKYERKGEVKPQITVNTHSLSLFVGETAQLKASPVEIAFTWTSEDTEVATVDADGLVRAAGAGSTFIVAASGSMTCRVPITATVKIPLTGFELNVGSIEMTPGKKQSIYVIPDPPNANDMKAAEWSSDNTDVAIVDYKGEIVAVYEGSTDITCRINGMEKAVNVYVSKTLPFMGPHILSAAAPKILKSVDFDLGGEGNAYHDTSTGNSAGSATSNNYRANNGDNNSRDVDIQSDGESIGYTAAGEWLIYTVEVQDAGNYLVSSDVAVSAESKYHIEVDDANVTGTVTIAATGGWSSWQWLDIPQPVALTAGKHKLKFYFEVASFNFRNLKFTYQP